MTGEVLEIPERSKARRSVSVADGRYEMYAGYSPQNLANTSGSGIICFKPSLCSFATSSRSNNRAWGNLFFKNSSRVLRGELGMCQLASTKIASLVTLEGLTRSGATFLEEKDREEREKFENDWVAIL